MKFKEEDGDGLNHVALEQFQIWIVCKTIALDSALMFAW